MFLLVGLVFALFSDYRVDSSSLTADFTNSPCPGELISLTCAVVETTLSTTWNTPGRDINVINPNSTEPIVRDQYTVQVVSVDVSGNMITSRLSTPAVNDLSIGCSSGQGSVGTVVIQTADPPNQLSNVRHSVQSSSGEVVNVSVQWDPPTVNGGRDDLNYTVTISPPAQFSTVISTTNTSVIVNTNTNYTVSVVATNCAGNSSVILYRFAVANCFQPSFNPGVESSVSSTLEDAVITYNCPESTPSVSTCDTSGSWSPDPALLVCPTTAPPVTCGPPSPPSSGSIVGSVASSSSVDTVIHYRCDEGLFPSENQPSVCGSDGMWSPNPGEIVCSNTSFTCSLPAPPTGGFIVQVSNSTVVFGCSEGFSPQENKTANCVAMNQWRPSPEQIMCEPVVITTMFTSGLIVGQVVGGVIGGIILVTVILIIIILVVVLLISKRHNDKSTSSDPGIELTDKFQGEYSELRHDGPKKKSAKNKPPADFEGYDRITHKLDLASQAYDDVNTKGAIGNSDGYSTLNNGQGAQRLPGYGQLNTVPTVEPVVYATLGVNPKTPTEAPEVDQHVVTYATVDITATNRQKAATMPASTKNSSAEQADKLLNLDQALVQLRPVQSRWQELAQALQVPDTYIQQIDESCGKDHANSMTEVVDYWMRSCSGQPTWRELADALKRIKENHLAKQLMSIYETGRLPVELDMNEVPKEVYKYDNAPPPPLPARSPTITDDTDSPGLSKTLPPSRPPKYNGDKGPSRPPKPPRKNESPVPPRPPKPPPKH